MVVCMRGSADNNDEYFGDGRGAGAGGEFVWGLALESPPEASFALSDRGLMAAFGEGAVPFFVYRHCCCCCCVILLLLCCCYCRVVVWRRR